MDDVKKKEAGMLFSWHSGGGSSPQELLRIDSQGNVFLSGQKMSERQIEDIILALQNRQATSDYVQRLRCQSGGCHHRVGYPGRNSCIKLGRGAVYVDPLVLLLACNGSDRERGWPIFLEHW